MSDHMTAEQLLPCPFCGAAAIERWHRSSDDGYFEVCCARTECTTFRHGDDEDRVRADWNTRAARFSGMAAVPAELLQIGELLRTQDNRITDQPLFLVQQKQTYVTEDDYNESRMVWVNEDGREAGEETARRFDSKYSGTGRRPKGWRHLAVFDVWEFVTGCFTEQGCKDYIARNGHNLKQPRIYAEASFRNLEYQIVRNWLKALPAPAAPEPPHD